MRLILFGGKGGVGKTSCASAMALFFAGQGHPTLLVSTDPAHSLSDCLDRQVEGGVQLVAGVGHLSALEIDPERLLAEFREQYHGELREILETSFYLDAADTREFLSLTIPGLDEIMAFKTIADLVEASTYEVVIIDTAPTGHTLRLLEMPEVCDQWIRALARLRLKYHYILGRFSRSPQPEREEQLFILKKTVKRIASLLRDPARCEFVVVTLPESMVIQETKDLLTRLSRLGISVHKVIVNQIQPSLNGGCPFCQEKRGAQQQQVRELETLFSHLELIQVPAYASQARGLEALKLISHSLTQGARWEGGRLDSGG